MPYAWTVEPGEKVDLKDYDPGHKAGLDKETAKPLFDALGEEISELQELLFAAGKTGLLLVFQARDTGGKDGAINHVLGYLHAQSCHATSFKAPTEEELKHDFLWRIHPHTPPRGGISIFNRSHYEDVIAVRVHDLVPKSVWKPRYDAINAFERLLTDSGTIVLKFYLHISKEEQEKRLLAREHDPIKAWKINADDWRERDYWKETQTAYEEALSRCSTKDAPWTIVAADHKWFRDLAIAEAIRNALAPHRKEWEAALEKIGREAKAELQALRAGQRS